MANNIDLCEPQVMGEPAAGCYDGPEPQLSLLRSTTSNTQVVGPHLCLQTQSTGHKGSSAPREPEEQQKHHQHTTTNTTTTTTATDCRNTRQPEWRRWSWTSSGTLTSSRANLDAPIGANWRTRVCRQANQFSTGTSARFQPKLHSQSAPIQRHKHSSKLKQVNNNKLSGQHITKANNTTTQPVGAAYRQCASRAGDGRQDAAPERQGEEVSPAAAASGCGSSVAGCGGAGGEKQNYDTSRAPLPACQAHHCQREDAKQEPQPAQRHLVLPEAPQGSQPRHNIQPQTNHNNIEHHNSIDKQASTGILASPVRVASGSSSPLPSTPQVTLASRTTSHETCATTTCLEEPLWAQQARLHKLLLSERAPSAYRAPKPGQFKPTDTPPDSRLPLAMEIPSAEARLQCWNNEAAEEGPAVPSSRYLSRAPYSIYPNNTLIADLNKCHRNVARAWPKLSWLGTRLKGCWRSATGAHPKFRRLRFQMPDPLVRSNVSITHDDYDKALCVLTSDVRYQLHLLLYRRAQAIWMLFTTLLCTSAALVVLSNVETIVTLGLICIWLALQLVGAIVTNRFRRKLDEMLEKSVAQVNSFFMEHNLLLGVIHSGSCIISKSKFLIPVLYFNTSACREYIESIINVDSRKFTSNNPNHNQTDHHDDTSKNFCQPKAAHPNQIAGSNGNGPLSANDTANHTSETTTDKHILDYSKIGLPLTKPYQMGLAQSQLAKKIILRYSQRWISLFDKRKLMFNDDQVRPRHLSTGKCLCQFIEEHFSHNNQQPKRLNTDNCKAFKGVKTKQVVDNHVSISITPDSEERIPNGKQHISALESYMLAKPTTKLSTISRFVSLKDRKKHRREYIEPVTTTTTTTDNPTCHSVFAQANYLQPLSLRDPAKGFLNGVLFTPYMNMDPFDQSSNGATNQSQVSGSSRGPTSSPDVSLQMDAESISRSDELVKKLRLLLELKKDEIQSLEGALFSPAYCKESPRSTLTNVSRADENSDRSLMNSNILNYQELNEVSAGKKMNLQRYGLFFLGASGTKKSHHHEETGRNQALKMC